eukprot:TRINITY_DN6341_c0_g1_i1.p1 TRINITY_DN6341_c0_g1~~TRINITY_DN6341_c0_g1_i1.p1  ORF type:complete len:308 (-),score=39.52 TRINITY_DN6341_c0_g1_i1:14-937(-)
MTTQVESVDTKHEDMIHDAQLDYYGKKLATCSSDGKIKIFEEVSGVHKHLQDLTGHAGPVWQIAWAHPRFGNILASCSYDRKVFIWKEMQPNRWAKIYEYAGHSLSVNSVSWAPHEVGLCLVCGSSDGHISVITHRGDDKWTEIKFQGHNLGVTAVSWGPPYPPASLADTNASNSLVKQFVSGGCDNTVKIWVITDTDKEPGPPTVLSGHSDWVRDVAWAPNLGLPNRDTIASCSQDGSVIIWTNEGSGNWAQDKLDGKFSGVVWRVSWSVTGNILAVSGADNKVTLWKEYSDREWKCINTLEEKQS